MSFIYHAPGSVIHPRKFTRKIEVLYDGGEEGFSLALIDWEGIDHIGIRWNIAFKERADIEKQMGRVCCEGAPSSKGVPSWFILPRELFGPELFDADRNRLMEMIDGISMRAG